jgi:hypothetical protein
MQFFEVFRSKVVKCRVKVTLGGTRRILVISEFSRNLHLINFLNMLMLSFILPVLQFGNLATTRQFQDFGDAGSR